MLCLACFIFTLECALIQEILFHLNLESEEFDDLDGNGNISKGNSSGRASVKSCFAAN